MTAREQRRRRRELRAMRRRVAGMIVLLSILAGLVLYAASHTWTGIEKGTDPAETDPLKAHDVIDNIENDFIKRDGLQMPHIKKFFL